MAETGLRKIAIHGVPRSGTSWIGEIVNSSPHVIYRYQPLFSFALRDFLTPASDREEIEHFFEVLAQTEDDFLDQKGRRTDGRFPQFAKSDPTHVAYKEVRFHNVLWNLLRKHEEVLLCAVIRNPLAVVCSWLAAPREFRRDLGWRESDEWRYALRKNLNRPEEFNGYEKWKEAALMFLELKRQYPERVFILRYSDLLKDPHQKTRTLFRFLGLEVTASTTDFLTTSRSVTVDDPYSVFQAENPDSKWRKELDPAIVAEICSDLSGTELEPYCD